MELAQRQQMALQRIDEAVRNRMSLRDAIDERMRENPREERLPPREDEEEDGNLLSRREGGGGSRVGVRETIPSTEER